MNYGNALNAFRESLHRKMNRRCIIFIWSPLLLLLIASGSSRMALVSKLPSQYKPVDSQSRLQVSELTQRLCRSAFHLSGNISEINAIPIYNSKFPNKNPELIWEVKYAAEEDKYTFCIDGKYRDLSSARNDSIDLHQSRKAPEGIPASINAQAARNAALKYLLEMESVVRPTEPASDVTVNHVRLNKSYKAVQWELDCTMVLLNRWTKHYRMWLNPIDGSIDSVMLMNRKFH